MAKSLNKLVRMGKSTNHYHYFDNRILPSHVDKKLAHKERCWYKSDYLFNELNIFSVIARPIHNERISLSSGSVIFSGHAYSGGGREVTRIELILDDGKTYLLAKRMQKEKPNAYRKYWCWVQWKI